MKAVNPKIRTPKKSPAVGKSAGKARGLISDRQRELMILLANWDEEGLPLPTTLAHRMGLANESSIRFLIKPLEESGLMRRVALGGPGLPKVPQLTEAGRKRLGLQPPSRVMNLENARLYAPLPVFPVSCGPMVETAPEPVFTACYLGDIFASYRHGDQLLIARGDSMVASRLEDDSIFDGDRCLMRPDVWPGEGEVAYVEYELDNGLRECTLKEWHIDEHNGTVTLKARNPAYKPIVRNVDELIVRGIVLEVVHSIRPAARRKGRHQ